MIADQKKINAPVSLRGMIAISHDNERSKGDVSDNNMGMRMRSIKGEHTVAGRMDEWQLSS